MRDAANHANLRRSEMTYEAINKYSGLVFHGLQAGAMVMLAPGSEKRFS
jgi:hypothetical protein